MIQLDEDWKAWLRIHAQRRTPAPTLIQAMTSAGFDSATATYLVTQTLMPGAEKAIPVPANPVIPPYPLSKDAGGYRNDVVPIAVGNRIDVGDRIVEVGMRIDKPCVITFHNVLSDAECAEVIARSLPRLKPSTTVNPETGKSDSSDARTSEGTFFKRCEEDFLVPIEERVARLLNWPLENGEGFSILRYGIGDEYRPHFDYFPPEHPGSQKRMAIGGQRVSTLIIYLNDVEQGGETHFPDAGIAVTPRKGSAVYFQYCNAAGQIDPLTRHAGKPVIAGEKWIMTKWMRQRRFGLES
ncbi:MAG: 2OG-Fe(II) oxygenase [Rhodocyclaceae bacterium]